MPKNYAKMQMCGDTKMQCWWGNRKGKEQKRINDTYILAHQKREFKKPNANYLFCGEAHNFSRLHELKPSWRHYCVADL